MVTWRAKLWFDTYRLLCIIVDFFCPDERFTLNLCIDCERKCGHILQKYQALRNIVRISYHPGQQIHNFAT